MADFHRGDQLLSQCGLNCGLCSMYIGNYCPGCDGGPGNQPCAVLHCAAKRGNVDYCYQCGEYPCERFAGAEAYDSFITHQHQFTDFARAQQIGLPAYHAEQTEKAAILRRLLAGYNDGRKKTLYCLAANLLELPALRAVMAQLEAETAEGEMGDKQKAAVAAEQLQVAATAQGVTLKLRQKPKSAI
jgi:hypothetical protein